MKYIAILLLLHANSLYCYSSLKDYAYFTVERRQVLRAMGEFFDQTIRENFPAITDTLSYKCFYECIIKTSSKVPFIVQVNRDQLEKINQILFKDENYYFFYALRLEDVGSGNKDSYRDSVPTVRYNTSNNYHSTTLPVPQLNKDGYIREYKGKNSSIIQAKDIMMVAGDISIILFTANILNTNLRTASDPEVKEFSAVLFWRYLCYCGGIDLENRKEYCDNC